MTVVNQNLPIHAEYLKSSEKFSIVWNDYVNREEEAKKEVMNMIKILESNGYSRTKAVAKIISDHQHLKGFSRATIYRELPDDMKRKYESSNIIMLPDYSDVSNETFIDEDGNEVFVCCRYYLNQ
jgi:DNA topoisomerase IB